MKFREIPLVNLDSWIQRGESVLSGILDSGGDLSHGTLDQLNMFWAHEGIGVRWIIQYWSNCFALGQSIPFITD